MYGDVCSLIHRRGISYHTQGDRLELLYYV